jgi:hypothetical protein
MAASYDRTSPQVVYASRAGCVADADLDAGTWTTDNSAALNAVLARASASSPITLLIDGAYGASQLDVKNGFITIEGMGAGTGLVNTKRTATIPGGDLIYNSNRQYFTTGSTSTVASHIKIKDLRLNGCRPDSDATRYGSMLIHLENIDDIEVSGCYLQDIDAYGIELAACTRWTVDRCLFHGAAPTGGPGTGSGQAGVQVEGACSFGTISDCYFRTHDDAIAINLGETALGSGGTGSAGQNHIVSNCHFDQCLNGIRYYAGAVSASGLVVTNCLASCWYHFVILNVEGGGGSGPHRNVGVSNCQATLTGPTPIGYFYVCGVVPNLQASNFTMASPTQGVPLLTGANTASVRSASFDGLKIHYDANGSAADYLYDGSFPLDELTIRGFEQVCDSGVTPTAPAALIKLAGAHGCNRIRLRDFAARYAGDIIQINNANNAGVADSIIITGLDASGLTGRAVDLAAGLLPPTVIVEGLWASAANAPVGVASGLTLTNLGTVGLYSTYATPYSGGGTVTNSITKTAGSYGGP